MYNANVVAGTPPRAVVTFASGNSTASTFGVTIYPISANSGNNQKQYLIESVGTVNGAQVIVHALVQEASLAKYALFINNNTGGYWASDNRYFDGPVHLNGGVVQGVLWLDNTNPLFNYTGTDAFTVTMPSIPYEHNTSGNSTVPTTAANWATVSAGGSASVKAGQPVVSLPSNNYTYEQEYAALGEAIPNPCTAPPLITPATYGVTYSASGGLWYHGTINQMTLSAVNNTTQVITTYQTVPLSLATVETVVTEIHRQIRRPSRPRRRLR